jgi:hypothetical protein
MEASRIVLHEKIKFTETPLVFPRNETVIKEWANWNQKDQKRGAGKVRLLARFDVMSYRYFGTCEWLFIRS